MQVYSLLYIHKKTFNCHYTFQSITFQLTDVGTYIYRGGVQMNGRIRILIYTIHTYCMAGWEGVGVLRCERYLYNLYKTTFFIYVPYGWVYRKYYSNRIWWEEEHLISPKFYELLCVTVCWHSTCHSWQIRTHLLFAGAWNFFFLIKI